MSRNYQSQQAQLIYSDGADIIAKINDNKDDWCDAVRDHIWNAIDAIEDGLRNVNVNVNVRNHNKLGVPPFRNQQDPRIKELKKRFSNAVHILCLLADYNLAQGAQPTQEDQQAVTNGEHALAQLNIALMEDFPTHTSGASSED